MMFITSHLHSGLNGVANRNKDIRNIMSRFVYGFTFKGQVQPQMPLPNVLIFMGDMNYRINGFKPSIVEAIAQDRYDILLQGEQLLIEKQLGNIPKFFKEGDIAFAPTFKR